MEIGPLAQLRVEEGCRYIALSHLTDATRARGRLDDPQDIEALHDLRVGLRRLRSLERAYRPQMRDSISKKLRRQLRELAGATNEARDTEVQIEWLSEQRDALNPRHRRGLEWMLEWLEQRKAAAYDGVRRQVAADFDEFAQKINRRLRRYTAVLAEEPTRFGAVTAELVIAHAEELAQQLGRVQSAFDDEACHEARIAAKRLRYLVEPLRDEVEGADPLVSRMKSLQDLLGHMHDVAVLSTEIGRAMEEASAERARKQHQLAMTESDAVAHVELRRDPRPGLLALAHRARERRDELFGTLVKKWLGAETGVLVEQFRALAERLNPYIKG